MTSIIENITVEDFKLYFLREFNYLNLWNETISYKINQVVFYENDFYISLITNNLNNIPSASSSWNITTQDYNSFINDIDIEKAFSQAKNMININLFASNDELLKICYLLLTANYLVIDLSMANGNGTSNFLISSKSVDGVSASYAIPETILKNPLFNYLSYTQFGLKYLNYLLPKLNGYSTIIRGTTLNK